MPLELAIVGVHEGLSGPEPCADSREKRGACPELVVLRRRVAGAQLGCRRGSDDGRRVQREWVTEAAR